MSDNAPTRAGGMGGACGSFTLIRHDVRGLKGSGPNGEVGPEDLLERGPDGRTRPKLFSRVKEIKVARNKILKRGLAWAIDRSLVDLTDSDNFMIPDIVFNRTTNPMNYFFVAADNDGGTPDKADERPLYDESDGQFDPKVPVHSSSAGKGRRSTYIGSGTVVDGMYRSGISYPTTNPYREIEYTLFAKANTPTFAFATVTFPVPGSLADADYVDLDDGINPVVRFELDKTGDGGTEPVVDISSAATAEDVRDAFAEAVTAWYDSTLWDAAAGGGGTVNLTHRTGGEIGNTTLATNNGSITFLQPSGGGGALEGAGGEDDYIDNLPIKALGLAEGLACGNGEADNRVAVRSIVGQAPTLIGYSDRVYEHEGTGLYSYSGSDNLGTNGEGYFVTAEGEQTLRSIPASGTDSISTTGNTVIMKNGNFTSDDVGRTFRISNSGTSNDGDKTIATVVNRHKITIVEALASEGDGFNADIVILNPGSAAFDGDVTAEAGTGVIDLGFKWRSADTTGPHELGRVWASIKSIRGIRVTGPAGTNKDNYLHTFKVQRLATQALGNGLGPVLSDDLEPGNPNHWVDVGAEVDFTASGQADNIFDAEDRGYEFLFNAAINCYGIKITSGQAFVGTGAVEIGEFYIFSERGVVTITSAVDDELELATNGVPSGPGVPGPTGSFRTFSLGDVTTTGDAANEDMQTIADAINKQVRGYELEALRGNFGHLWIRSTVAGDNSQMDLDTEPTAGVHSKLGLGAAQVQKVGETQIVRKLPEDALTLIYRLSLSGDLPVA